MADDGFPPIMQEDPSPPPSPPANQDARESDKRRETKLKAEQAKTVAEAAQAAAADKATTKPAMGVAESIMVENGVIEEVDGVVSTAKDAPSVIEYKAPGKLPEGTTLAEILKQAEEDVKVTEADEAIHAEFYKVSLSLAPLQYSVRHSPDLSLSLHAPTANALATRQTKFEPEAAEPDALTDARTLASQGKPKVR